VIEIKNELNIASILDLHREAIISWKEAEVSLRERGFLRIVEENHAFNYQLWHAEDRARRDDLGYEFVYQAKREIDHCNQQRNDRMEEMDAFIVGVVQPLSASDCPVHSETPGMMIDRLSILALKAYHMGLQAVRQDVDETHRERCRQKREVIDAQIKQLAVCWDVLWTELLMKKRTFCVYHQFKMYNDSTLNPELYQAYHKE
jgi:hypothetical protein